MPFITGILIVKTQVYFTEKQFSVNDVDSKVFFPAVLQDLYIHTFFKSHF